MVKPYNAETIFPWSLVDEVIETLKQKECEFITYNQATIAPPKHIAHKKLRTYHDIYRYIREYAAFKSGSNNSAVQAWYTFWHLGIKRKMPALQRLVNRMAPPKGNPTIILQHDADRQPYKTLDMMQREATQDVVSSIFFFKDRNMWDDDTEPYDLDVPAIQSLEKNGFEIGYHLNAYELADYDLQQAKKKAEADLTWFDANFNLCGIVPHGGVRGPNGINNMHFPYEGQIRKYIWYFDGLGILKDRAWSDGNVYTTSLPDPREVAKHIKPGERVLFLMHPQYYGDTLMDDWESLPISKEKWWRDLWNLA